MAPSMAQRKAKRRFKRKEKQNRKKETPIQKQQRCSVRNEKDRARGPRKPLTTKQKQAKRDYEAAQHKQKKESKKLTTVPFSAVPGFELNRYQHRASKIVRRRLRHGTACRAIYGPQLCWFQTFIGGGKEHTVVKETQKQREARLVEQRGRSARNRSTRTSQQKLIRKERDCIRQRLRREYYCLDGKTTRELAIRLRKLSTRACWHWLPESVKQRDNRLQKDADSTFLSRDGKREEEEMFKEMAEAKMQLCRIGLKQRRVREEIGTNEARLRHLQICSSCLALTSSSSQPSGGMKLAKWQSKIRYQCSDYVLRRSRSKPWCCTCIGQIETCIIYLEECREKLSDLDEEALSVGRRFPMAATL